MSPNLLGLLQACKEEPFDDGLRLILADYLEDHGDPDRAELIRLQLTMGEDGWGTEPDLVAQQIRSGQLHRANAERWLGPCPTWYERVRIERGFLVLTCSPREFLDRPPSELPPETVPWLEQLNLTGEQDGREEAYSSPVLGLFRTLDLGTVLADPDEKLQTAELGHLVTNRALEGVRSLELSYGRLDLAAVEMLVRCEHLRQLQRLDLSGNPLNDAALVALAEAPWLSGLTRLDLGGWAVDETGVRALLSGPNQPRLQRLTLCHELNEGAARALVEAESLASVTHFSLPGFESHEALCLLADAPHLRPLHVEGSFTELGSGAAEPLATGRFLQRVERLYLADNDFTADASAMLLASENLADLKVLQMWNPLNERCCELLGSSGVFTRLELLSLHDVKVRAKEIQALFRGNDLQRLASLDLTKNRLGEAGTLALAEADLPCLESLDLTDTGLAVRGLRRLVASGRLTPLKRLDLCRNLISDAGARELARLPQSELTELVLRGARMTAEGITALARCSGLAHLLSLRLGDNPIGDAGVVALVAAQNLPRLQKLDLYSVGMTSAGAEALLAWPRREDLLSLSLSDNHMAEELIDRVEINEL